MSIKQHFYTCDVASTETWLISADIDTQATSAMGDLLDVLILHELEPLTQAIEDTFALAVDWQRVDGPNCMTEASCVQADIIGHTGDELLSAARLYCPLAALPILRSGSGGAAHWSSFIRWHPYHCSLVLSRAALDDEQIDDLGSGALFVIAESYSSQWPAALKLNEQLFIPGHYDPVSDQWTSVAGDQSKEPTVPGVQVDSSVDFAESDTVSSRALASRTAKSRVDGQSRVDAEAAADREFRIEMCCQVNPDDWFGETFAFQPGIDSGDISGRLFLTDGRSAKHYGSLLPLGAGQVLLLE